MGDRLHFRLPLYNNSRLHAPYMGEAEGYEAVHSGGLYVAIAYRTRRFEF